MVSVNFRKLFCQDVKTLEDHLTGVPRDAPSRHNVEDPMEQLCLAMTKDVIGDRVTIERSAEPGAVLISYKGVSGKRGFWMFDDGRVSGDLSTTSPAYYLGDYSTLIIGALFGVRALSPAGKETLSRDPYQSAATYLRCLNQRGASRCRAVKNRLVAAVQDSENRAIEQDLKEAGTRLIAKGFQEAQQIWAKVDAFLAAATARDDNDSDLDVLLEIVHRHAATRPSVPASNSRDAGLQWSNADRMLKEFEGSEALRRLVYDEGDCKTSEYTSGFDNCPHESYTQTCSLGGYAFSNSGCKSEPSERPISDPGSRGGR